MAPATNEREMKKQKPISDEAKAKSSGCGRVILALFGLVFVLVGVWAFYSDGLNPYLQKQQSANWPIAECKVVRADTEVHHNDDSTSYSVDFYYTFRVEGKTYSGNRYSFANEHGSRSEAKRQKRAFPAGSSRKCFYNPEDPSDCVLDRTNPDQGWLPIFGPFIFIVLGGAVTVGALFFGWAGNKKSVSGAIKSRSAKADGMLASGGTGTLGGSKETLDHPADRLDAEWAGPLKLKPEASRGSRAFAVGFMALVWNSVVVTIIIANDLLQNFSAQIGFGLFMIPITFIGLLTIVLATYYIAALLNPSVEIALSRGAVPLGGTVDVAWQIEGRFERIKKLTIHVQASQFATYQRGTDTTTAVAVFEKMLVTESTDVSDIAFGSTAITIPAESMHTFDAKQNKIKWQVTVHGEIPWAPDIVENYDFRVTPIKTESRSS